MTIICVCTNDKVEVGKLGKGEVWDTCKKEYVRVAIRAIRQITYSQYKQFCMEYFKGKLDNPDIVEMPFHKYYEVEIMD